METQHPFEDFIAKLNYVKILDSPLKLELLNINPSNQFDLQNILEIYEKLKKFQIRYKYKKRLRIAWPENEKILATWLILKNFELTGQSIQDYDAHKTLLKQIFIDRDENSIRLFYANNIAKHNKLFFTNEQINYLQQLEKDGIQSKKWQRITILMQEKFQRFDIYPQQIKDYYRNHLQKQNSDHQWTKEEDLLFLYELQKYKTNWTKISEKLTTKSSLQIKNRFTRLQRSIEKVYTEDEIQEKFENKVECFIHFIQESPDQVFDILNLYKTKKQMSNTKFEKKVKQVQKKIEQEMRNQAITDKLIYEKLIKQKFDEINDFFNIEQSERIENQINNELSNMNISEISNEQKNELIRQMDSFINSPDLFNHFNFQSNPKTLESQQQQLQYDLQIYRSEDKSAKIIENPSCYLIPDQYKHMLFTPFSYQQNQNSIQSCQKQIFTWNQYEIEKEENQIGQANESQDAHSAFFNQPVQCNQQNQQDKPADLKQKEKNFEILQEKKYQLLAQLADLFIKKQILQTQMENSNE